MTAAIYTRELKSCMNLIADKLRNDRICVLDLMSLIVEMSKRVTDLERARKELQSYTDIIPDLTDKLAEIDGTLKDPVIKEYMDAYDSISIYKGSYLINESYFEQYAIELIDDVGEIDRAAVEGLKQDHTKITIGSKDYYVSS